MNIAIVKYNAGNIQSVLYALERIGLSALVTDDAEQIQKADKVIFPGVGEARTAMQYLQERNLDQLIQNLKQPVLGICLGIFENKVKYFTSDTPTIKVPQMGWNTISQLKTNLFHQIPEKSYAYFVHGYYAELSEYTIATTHYIQPYSSALQKDNFYGVQFHPEKSAAIGEQILQNFIHI
jgi:glutamine amidotransferase